MKRLLICDPDKHGLSWYRGTGALEKLRKHGIQTVGHSDVISWRSMRGVDALFMLRAHQENELRIVSLAQQAGIKVWSDWDDPAMDVPSHHPDWEFWQHEAIQKSWQRLLQSVDVISTTTPHLRENLRRRGARDAVIVPNAIDDDLFPVATPPNKTNPRIVMWRGGKSHEEDLRSFRGVFEILQKEKVRLIFFGPYPKSVAGVLIPGMWSNVRGTDPLEFFHALRQFNAPVQVIPLEPNELNACKSNVAYLEASWLGGSACVHPVWHNTEAQGSAITYTNEESPEQIANAILSVLEKPQLRDEIVTKAQKFIAERHLLSQTTQLRLEILSKML